MSSLDSRFLTYLDCYWQRFATPGEVSFAVTGPLAELVRQRRPFTINVVEGNAAAPSAQHDVLVRFDKGQFSLDTPAGEVAAGDVLMWHSAGDAPPYAVWGKTADGEFSSASINGGAVFSHAFGAPGEFDWVDANGSGLSGRIIVQHPDNVDRAAALEWNDVLRKGALVTIDGDHADPPEIRIVTGQTVFFAVKNAPGISITDASLLQGKRG